MLKGRLVEGPQRRLRILIVIISCAGVMPTAAVVFIASVMKAPVIAFAALTVETALLGLVSMLSILWVKRRGWTAYYYVFLGTTAIAAYGLFWMVWKLLEMLGRL